MIRFSDDKPEAAKVAKPTAAKPTAAKPAALEPAAEPANEFAAEARTTIDLNGRPLSVPGQWSDADLAPFLKALGAAKLNEKTVGKTKVGRHLMSTLGDPAAVTAELTTLAATVRAGLA